mmetsp:Transcript_86464/g.222718  ORF Transcript_86464/g.222718 Transcript_86464/m.222718 type:complete len:1855 (+) Transcript_86464:120-5684(+)
MIQTTQSFEVRGPPEVRNVETVLRETLEKLRTAAPKRLKELRDECQADLERLDNSAAGGVNADEFIKPLKLACEGGGSPKVVSVALDAIQKLLAYGFLTGRGADPFKDATVGAAPRVLMDTIIESVCGCQEQVDEAVQLQMVRALLTAVTSQTCEVHGNSLMLAVSTCFKIHRDSKSSMNQRTAQSSLTQILNVVTQRMELSSADMSRRTLSFEDCNQNRQKVAAAIPQSDLALLPPKQLLHDWTQSYLTRILDQVVLEDVRRRPTPTGAPPEGAGGPGAGPPGKFGWCVVCRGTAAHYCVETKDPVCGKACKYKNLERIGLVESHYGPQKEEDLQAQAPPIQAAESEKVVSEATFDTTDTSVQADTPSRMDTLPSMISTADEVSAETLTEHGGDKASNPYSRDALLVFSYLCKLSMKDLPPGQADTRVVRSKKMALELVLSMLQNCGPVFRSSDPFITVLKKLLCNSLIKNSVCSIPKIFGLSFNIFVVLITSFKEHLRTEIGVFIEQIFLRILETGNSTYHHKFRVLQVFSQLCTDASTALELFLNFDCDVDEKNIFERMIDCLSKIAQGKYTAIEHAGLIQPHQEQELKMLALDALVKLMGAIVDWARCKTEANLQAAGVLSLEPKEGEESRRDDADSDAEDDSTSDAKSAATGFSGAASTTSSLPQSSILTQKQRKLELQVGVNKFNMKPKRGIEFLTQNGFVSDEPQAVAALLQNQSLGLDKTAIGDYLGEDKPFNKGVLYALVDSQNFRDQDLDASLRNFLSIFRLPGEAQKIDRMMEKFAEKFCSDNADKFANADCAFVLSFSLIMLQTDLHNPGVKNKMTKDEFVRNNRGINNNEDLPRQYLEQLYEGVANNPISLKEDEDARNRMDSQAAQGASQKFELFVRETENIVFKSQEMMKQKLQRKNSMYVAAESVEHVRPLFEVACWPYLATLAVLLEMQDSAASVELCIEGFKHCIRIAARFDMDTERDAFVSSLAKFTYLTTVKEMKQKNIECIKALLAIGLSEGNNLGPSWQYVLHCISQLERMCIIGQKVRQDFQFFQGDEEATANAIKSAAHGSTSGTQVLKRRAHGLGVSALVALGADDRQVELVNSESIVSQIDSGQIELLFNRSTSLSSGAVVHFVSQLVRVSKEELALADQPRIFSLQKLVEVADYNMGRMRVVWTRIWRVLSNHFVEVASHQNIRVCMYAIDSLRQLAMKFLEKDELTNYNFQAEFLKPFEVVMGKAGINKDVKDLIVQIISNMVQARINNIKSGWKTVFHILYAAAQEHNNEVITQSAFICIEKVIELNYSLFVENFSDGIRTLLAFGQCKANLQTSLQAIGYLRQAAEYLADESKPKPPPPPSGFPGGVAGAGGEVAVSGHPAAHWFPILRGLSMLVSDPRREVRSASLNGVFDCLRDHGSAVFDEDTWRMVFNGVVKPLFDDIHCQLQNGDPNRKPDGSGEGTAASWAASMGPPTCLAALTALVRLFEAHVDSLSFLLDDVLRLIENCIQHDTEAVARIGVEGFKQLLVLTGKNLKKEAWQKVTASALQLFNESMPTKLLDVQVSAPNDGQLPFQKDDVVIQCVVQLLLIDMLQETIAQHYEHIPPEGIMTLLDALQRSFEFAQEFNGQIELRQTLKRLGFMREMKQLPGLLKQEREALSCSLKLLFQVHADPRMQTSDVATKAMERLMALCCTVLRNYAAKEKLLQEQADAVEDSSLALPIPKAQVGHVADPSDNPTMRDREAAVVEMEREVLGLVPIISEVILTGLRELTSPQFARYAPELFPLLCDLAVVNSRESLQVRQMVREVLQQQVLPIIAAGSPLVLAGSAAAPARTVVADETPAPVVAQAARGGDEPDDGAPDGVC